MANASVVYLFAPKLDCPFYVKNIRETQEKLYLRFHKEYDIIICAF